MYNFDFEIVSWMLNVMPLHISVFQNQNKSKIHMSSLKLKSESKGAKNVSKSHR